MSGMRIIRRLAWMFGLLFLLSACHAVSSVASVPTDSPLPSTAAPQPTALPTSAPTPEPTPAPTPEPTPEPTPTPVTIEMLDSGMYDDFFDDAVFIGDSVTWTFARYVSAVRREHPDFLGDAKFLGTISMSVRIASQNKKIPEGITFQFRGKAVTLTEGIQLTGAKKAFILLGLNDIAIRNWTEVETWFVTMIDVIRAECPDVEIILQGVLPVTQNFCETENIKIECWNSFNEILERIAAEQNVQYLFFGDQLMDEKGYLRLDLSSDKKYHLNEAGEEIWVRNLRAFAVRQAYPDTVVLFPEESR